MRPSNCTSRMLRVGIAAMPLITFISTWVPKVGRPWPVTALSASTFFAGIDRVHETFGSLICPRRGYRAPRPP